MRWYAVLAALVAVALIACGGGGSDDGATTTPAATPTEDDGLGAARAVEADDSPSLPGEYIDLPAIYGGAYGATARHVTRDIDYASDCTVSDSGEEICNGDPPAGGPHWSGACARSPADSPLFCGPARWGIYREPWQPETLVHNMEHGGVVLWYNTEDQDAIDELESLFEERLNAGQILVMAPYPNLAPETNALTSWSRRDLFPASEYTRERVEAFVDAHERRFNPERS